MVLRSTWVLAACMAMFGAAQGAEPAREAFRQPFDLHLEMDGKRYYEEHFARMPYVFKDAVFLFKGDAFGVTVKAPETGAATVSYEADVDQANVRFKFSQERTNEGGFMMMLTIENKTGKTLTMEALMTVPGEKGTFKTSIIPVRPGLTNFESWPHAIVQLVLHEIGIR